MADEAFTYEPYPHPPGSRLLQRYCVRQMLGLDDLEFEIGRTKQNKPYLVQSDAVRAAAAKGRRLTNA